MTQLLKKSQLAQTIFLFFRIVSSKNELFLSQNIISRHALKKHGFLISISNVIVLLCTMTFFNFTI